MEMKITNNLEAFLTREHFGLKAGLHSTAFGGLNLCLSFDSCIRRDQADAPAPSTGVAEPEKETTGKA